MVSYNVMAANARYCHYLAYEDARLHAFSEQHVLYHLLAYLWRTNTGLSARRNPQIHET